MAIEGLPIQYRMEIYVGSFVNDPEASFHSNIPFLSIQVGDEMEPCLWPNTGYGQDKLAKVKAIRHLIHEIKGSHIGHSLSVCVEIIDKPRWSKESTE